MFKNLKFKTEQPIAGYILYIYNVQHLMTVLKPLPRIEPVVSLIREKETYSLAKPSFFLREKPVFICIRGFPVSIEIQFLDKRLIEMGYSAEDIHAKINSIYVNTVFRRKIISLENVAMTLLLIAVSALTTFIITYLSLTVPKVPVEPPPNPETPLGLIKLFSLWRLGR